MSASTPLYFSCIGFETKAVAEKRRDRLHNLLDRHKIVGPAAAALLSCSSDAPCFRDGCPCCLRWFRKHLLRRADELDLQAGAWTRASLILNGHSFPPGELSKVDLPRLTKAVVKRIGRSAFSDTIVIGGWDISLNTFSNSEAGWNVHLYLLINVPCSDELKAKVVSAFDLCEIAPRPSRISEVDPDGFFKVLSYAHKAEFSWRSGYFAKKRLKADGTPHKNTEDKSLKPDPLLELTTWLSQYPVGTRLILRNIKRQNPPWKKLRLRLLKSLQPGG